MDIQNNNKNIDISHYFDWAATSPADEKILRDSLENSIESWANPSSVHNLGKKAKNYLDSARDSVAKTLGVKSQNIFFTSGGTESNHIPLLAQLNKPSTGTILISSIEHPAIREQANALSKCGWKIVSIPSDKDGIITADAVENLLTNDTTLVCVMAVNNETGSIQPIYEIADRITKWSQGKRKPKFHVDCVQAAGKIPLNINYKGIDSAAFSAHKICGPRGIGVLYLESPIEPFLKGGGQEKGMRSGTENLFGAIAISKVLEKYYNKDNSTQKEITDDFILKLSQLKGGTIIPPSRIEKKELFSPYVLQVAFNNIPGNVMLRALDSKGFYISTGSACSSTKNSRPVLEAMHVDSKLRETSVRFSFGPTTTKDSVDELFEAVKEINNTFNKV